MKEKGREGLIKTSSCFYKGSMADLLIRHLEATPNTQRCLKEISVRLSSGSSLRVRSLLVAETNIKPSPRLRSKPKNPILWSTQHAHEYWLKLQSRSWERKFIPMAQVLDREAIFTLTCAALWRSVGAGRMFPQAVLLPRLLFLRAAGASAPSPNCNCSRASSRRRTRTDRGSWQPLALKKWEGHSATGP